MGYNLIAFTFQIQQKYLEALKYHQKALDVNIKFHGEMHRDTAMCYSHIAGVYFCLKKYPEAVINAQKAVEIAIQTLGKEHHFTKTFELQLKQYIQMKQNYKK